MVSTIQNDFDRIALLSSEGWNHNSHYHDFLLRHLPARCEYALDVGCGTGAFSRCLADRADRVLGLDLSPQMIRIARERAAAHTNVEFQVADALAWNWPVAQFDSIVSIATLHHLLPLGDVLTRMKTALKANGAIAILDLYQSQGAADLFSSALAMPVHMALRLLKTGRLRDSHEMRHAWAEHGRHDTFLTLAQVRQTCAAILPGAQVRKHLLWRYSIVWTSPPI